MKPLMSFGNLKLPSDYGILNITTARDCASKRLGMCQLDACGLGSSKCYARKPEKSYPAVLPYRLRQQAWWDQGIVAMVESMCTYLGSLRRKVTAIRVGEAGDFRNTKDVVKFQTLAYKLPNYTWYCYTARKDLFTPTTLEGLPTNAVVNGSGWMAHNAFIVLHGEQGKQKMDHTCPGDCRFCSACLTRGGLKIGVAPH